MSGQSDAYLQKLLSDAAAAWSPGPGISAEEAEEVRRLLPLYYRHTDPDDIAARSPEQLCGTAAQHRAFGSTRQPGRAKVRVYTPTADEHGWDQQTSVVEVVTDNAPFLVSSATMALDALSAGVRLVVHPQLTVARGVEGDLLAVDPSIGGDGLLPVDESWMHIEIDRQSDPERIKEITHRLEQVLADVRNVDELSLIHI